MSTTIHVCLYGDIYAKQAVALAADVNGRARCCYINVAGTDHLLHHCSEPDQSSSASAAIHQQPKMSIFVLFACFLLTVSSQYQVNFPFLPVDWIHIHVCDCIGSEICLFAVPSAHCLLQAAHSSLVPTFYSCPGQQHQPSGNIVQHRSISSNWKRNIFVRVYIMTCLFMFFSYYYV